MHAKRAKKLCEITGETSLSDLRESHVLIKRPFVYRGFFSPDGSWTDDALLELIGDTRVPVFYTEGDQSAFADGRLFVQLVPFREMTTDQLREKLGLGGGVSEADVSLDNFDDVLEGV